MCCFIGLPTLKEGERVGGFLVCLRGVVLGKKQNRPRAETYTLDGNTIFPKKQLEASYGRTWETSRWIRRKQ